MKQATLLFLLKEDQILLAMKKRDFGKGLWNGVGGKVKEGEAVLQAVIRETNEEIGVEIEEGNLFHHGDLAFEFPTKPDWNQTVAVFSTTTWKGEPTESEEMKPQWFTFSEIPYTDMWWDDKIWLPSLLEGKRFSGRFVFGEDEKEIISQEFKILE